MRLVKPRLQKLLVAIVVIATILLTLSLTNIPSKAASIETKERIKESNQDKIINLWKEIENQRNLLEEESKRTKKPLRESLDKQEFANRFTLLPYGKKVDSALLKEGVEIRIATIPKNIEREGKPYSIVAMLHQTKDNGLKTYLIPDEPELGKILNIATNWDYSKQVDDAPKIVDK
jgi:hypothetical protein